LGCDALPCLLNQFGCLVFNDSIHDQIIVHITSDLPMIFAGGKAHAGLNLILVCANPLLDGQPDCKWIRPTKSESEVAHEKIVLHAGLTLDAGCGMIGVDQPTSFSGSKKVKPMLFISCHVRSICYHIQQKGYTMSTPLRKLSLTGQLLFAVVLITLPWILVIDSINTILCGHVVVMLWK